MLLLSFAENRRADHYVFETMVGVAVQKWRPFTSVMPFHESQTITPSPWRNCCVWIYHS